MQFMHQNDNMVLRHCLYEEQTHKMSRKDLDSDAVVRRNIPSDMEIRRN